MSEKEQSREMFLKLENTTSFVRCCSECFSGKGNWYRRWDLQNIWKGWIEKVCYYSRRSYQSANRFGSAKMSSSLLFASIWLAKRKLTCWGWAWYCQKLTCFSAMLNGSNCGCDKQEVRFGRKCQRQARESLCSWPSVESKLSNEGG